MIASPKKPFGRPCKRLQPGTVSRLEKAITAGLQIRDACRVAGISDKSYYRWLKDAELAPEGHELRDFRDTVYRANASAINRMVTLIQLAALKDWRAAAWFLERRYSKDWGRVRHVSARLLTRSQARNHPNAITS